MKANCEEIVALLHAEMPFPQMMKEIGTSKTEVGVKYNLKEQWHVKYKPGSGREPSVVTPG